MTEKPSREPTADVRMRGFAKRHRVDDALAWIAKHAKTLEAESVHLGEASGRVLAEEIRSRVNVPGFARAMMDGFAVRADDVAGASSYQPTALTIVGQAMPGQACPIGLNSGQAIKIMTGAPFPQGADAVLPVEQVEFDDAVVRALAEVPSGKNVAAIGEDIALDEVVLSPGRRLRPQDVGVLASIGVADVSVVRRPRVRIIVTGNELLPPGQAPSGYQIVDSNSPMLDALIVRDGGLPSNPGIVPDVVEQVREALQSEADVYLVSGGSSVGEEDLAPQLVREMGQLDIHGVAMRPSSPAGMGRIGSRLVFLLPGNPVSCLSAYDFFAGAAIRRLGGRSSCWPYPKIKSRLSRKLVSAVGRTDYARVRFAEAPEGQDVKPAGKWVEPLAIRGASILSSTTRADGFLIIEADSEGFPAGHEVTVFLYDDPATVSQRH